MQYNASLLAAFPAFSTYYHQTSCPTLDSWVCFLSSSFFVSPGMGYVSELGAGTLTCEVASRSFKRFVRRNFGMKCVLGSRNSGVGDSFGERSRGVQFVSGNGRNGVAGNMTSHKEVDRRTERLMQEKYSIFDNVDESKDGKDFGSRQDEEEENIHLGSSTSDKQSKSAKLDTEMEKDAAETDSFVSSSFDVLELQVDVEKEKKAATSLDSAQIDQLVTGDGSPETPQAEQNREFVGKPILTRKKQVLRRSNMLAKQVISMQSALTLGFVAQLWVDTRSWVVLLVEVRPSLLSGDMEKFLLEDICQVGDVVLVPDETVLENEIKMIGFDTLVGYSVVTPSQRNLGKVRGYTFNVNTGAVELLELDSFGISIIPASLVSTYGLLVEDVIEVTADMVIVQEDAATRLQRLTKGFLDTQNKENLKDEIDKYSSRARGPKKTAYRPSSPSEVVSFSLLGELLNARISASILSPLKKSRVHALGDILVTLFQKLPPSSFSLRSGFHCGKALLVPRSFFEAEDFVDDEEQRPYTYLKGKKSKNPHKHISFKQRTIAYMEPFTLDVFISKRFVSASITHRVTSKQVAVAGTNSKDIKAALQSRSDIPACLAIGRILADRAREADVYTATYTPRERDKFEGSISQSLRCCEACPSWTNIGKTHW
ncbi:hypothetical protein H6P81_014615 [Aristolochia fimbriata]|uniref:PRC-barrel domain-containing protein n=1 Tax=Aristolochia fimbriata TaxID=158543 RepID=A0AAV7E573_ARIFI|nr:hypothetical protein H6P81_014615 [Aristolochia fimbriata]